VIFCYNRHVKILSIVEARVNEAQWKTLREGYEKVDRQSLPTSLINSCLVQDIKEPELWRIVTIWESLEAMSEYRKSVDTPAWILVFEAANVTPDLIINTIEIEK